MKKCPYCAEKIKDEAIVCRYCGRDLPVPETVIEPVEAPVVGLEGEFVETPKQDAKLDEKSRYKKAFIMGGISIAPPLITLLSSFLMVGPEIGMIFFIMFPIGLFFAIRSIKFSKGNTGAMFLSVASVVINGAGVLVAFFMIFIFSILFSAA